MIPNTQMELTDLYLIRDLVLHYEDDKSEKTKLLRLIEASWQQITSPSNSYLQIEVPGSSIQWRGLFRSLMDYYKHSVLRESQSGHSIEFGIQDTYRDASTFQIPVPDYD